MTAKHLMSVQATYKIIYTFFKVQNQKNYDKVQLRRISPNIAALYTMTEIEDRQWTGEIELSTVTEQGTLVSTSPIKIASDSFTDVKDRINLILDSEKTCKEFLQPYQHY